MKHLISVDQFSRVHLDNYCSVAGWFMFQQHTFSAKNRILANLFYEPSTRTSSSFAAAMARLGGTVIQINHVEYSSVAKGETLEDTIRTMQCYADVIVLRHSEVGAAQRAVSVASVPIINAGDGVGEHPTQALLDLFTIQRERSRVDGLHVTMIGDLLHGRTVKSLAKLLRNYDVTISWVSPEALRIPPEFRRAGEIETDDLHEVLDVTDVLYVTRVQKERLGFVLDDALHYRVTVDHMARAKANLVLMHPLPRVGEIPTDLDSDPRSAYFRQMKYGLYMRMAVLHSVLGHD
jgi:aspartate carbamoyltransferase